MRILSSKILKKTIHEKSRRYKLGEKKGSRALLSDGQLSLNQSKNHVGERGGGGEEGDTQRRKAGCVQYPTNGK